MGGTLAAAGTVALAGTGTVIGAPVGYVVAGGYFYAVASEPQLFSYRIMRIIAKVQNQNIQQPHKEVLIIRKLKMPLNKDKKSMKSLKKSQSKS